MLKKTHLQVLASNIEHNTTKKGESICLQRKNQATVAAAAYNINWSEYFASIHSVCPWSGAYWRKQKIDVQVWKGTGNITPLDDYVARIWIHKHASSRLLEKMHHRIAECRSSEEWLYSHPINGKHSSPVPVFLQQDRNILENARRSLGKDYIYKKKK